MAPPNFSEDFHTVSDHASDVPFPPNPCHPPLAPPLLSSYTTLPHTELLNPSSQKPFLHQKWGSVASPWKFKHWLGSHLTVKNSQLCRIIEVIFTYSNKDWYMLTGKICYQWIEKDPHTYGESWLATFRTASCARDKGALHELPGTGAVVFQKELSKFLICWIPD